MTPQSVAIIRGRMHIQHQIAKGAGRNAFKLAQDLTPSVGEGLQ